MFRDLESIINGLTPPQAPFTLGNTSFLSQETTQERQALYSQLVNSYKWIDKVLIYFAAISFPLPSIIQAILFCSYTNLVHWQQQFYLRMLWNVHISTIQQSVAVPWPHRIILHHSMLTDDLFLYFTYRIYIFIKYCRAVDNLLNTIDRGFNDMSIKVWRPFASNAIVHVRIIYLVFQYI